MDTTAEDMLLDTSGRAFLAPLSTFTNLPFRLLCQRHGAQGTVVPLVSAKAIQMRGIKMPELDPDPEERFAGIQIFGSSPQDIGDCAARLAKAFDFIKFIDINCACPVPKVVRNGAGSALLNRPDTAAAMIRKAKGCGIPVTVKIRKIPIAKKTPEFSLACERAGADAIFVHARTPGQGYSGEADWKMVAMIAEAASIPVIGSGDVRSMEQGRSQVAQARCSSFMVGRAAMADPGIFSNPKTDTHERKHSLFLEYISLCEEYGTIHFPDLKSKALQMFSGFPDSVALRQKIGKCPDQDSLLKTVDPFRS